MNDKDCLRRFIFEQHNIRGEWVKLNQSLQQAKQHQVLVSQAVESQLGQALAAVALLSATIKFNGAMIMQLQGKGELTALVAQASNDQKIRGLVRSNDTVSATDLKAMIGEGGRMVLTIEVENGERYQGIVAIEANNLAGVVQDYFSQSEQLQTRLWLFADQHQAAGLLIQELPSDKAQDKLDWQRIEMLANTVTAAEMLDLDCETLLYRLFNEEKLRLYAPDPVKFHCGCSHSKISETLAALGRQELEDILSEHQHIKVDCQFCGAHYQFDKVDVESLLANAFARNGDDSITLH